MTHRAGRLARFVVPLTTAVALSGAAGAALAANIETPNTNAGQGVGEVDGFTVTGIAYATDTTATTDPDALVDDVSFDIVRDDQATAVDDANADVWIQLRSDSANSNWVSCAVTAGAAACDTTALDVTMADLAEVSIVAYDI